MKNIKKFLALGLTAATMLAMTACGAGNGGAAGAAATGDTTISTTARDIVIGSWWRQYYATGDVLEDSADWTGAQFADDDDDAKHAEKEVNQRVALAKFDKVASIKENMNIDFTWVNLTYDGTKESLNTSVLAGAPDCDIYMVDAGMAIPAQANGLLVDLKTIVPADDDLFTNQTVFSYLDLGDDKACILKVQGGLSNTYPLGFNLQMLEENNLEDPRDLWDRGEWTWDKFLEYCEILTQDTDGDGQIDQYGYCGFANDTLNELLMSNGTAIAGGQTETLTSAATGEVLQMFQDLYSPAHAYPYDYYYNGGNAADSMRIQYNDGTIGFFPIAVWIQNANGNYPMDNGGQGNLAWDTVYVHWPVGPSGNKDTNPAVNASGGNFFVIPAGVEEPLRVYYFLYDLYNWFDGDTSFRDDPATATWWYNETANKEEIKESNWNLQLDCLARPGMELYDSLGVEFELETLIDGTTTPAQWQETYKNAFQDALDATFGN